MKTTILHEKLERYLNGEALPAETRQIQAWLSSTEADEPLTDEHKQEIEDKILAEIQADTAYPLFYPKKEGPWWQKITAFF
jgi:hypothetical protein